MSPMVGRLPQRPPLTGVMLALALVATAGLTWETVQSSRSAAQTLQSVQRDYATFVAWQFAREAGQRLETTGTNALNAARHQLVERPGAHDESGCDCEPNRWFREQFVWRTADQVPDEPDDLRPLFAQVRDALADTTARPGRRLVIVGRGESVRVAWWQLQTGPARHIVATLATPGFIKTLFDELMVTRPLLPETLVDANTRDAFGIVVHSPGGEEVYSTGSRSPLMGDVAPLSERLGALRVTASIDRDKAGSLVIGGSPAARWPLALTLLAVSAGLVALALVQMRREVVFARRRSDFVSGVSHELRTPLAQIRLFGETLMLGRVRSPEEGRRAAEVIVQEARRLSSLVDTVLLFSRLERQTVSLVRQEAHVSDVLTDVVEAFRPFAHAKQMNVVCETSGQDGPRMVDAGAIRQVILNLLDNAVKYGPHGQTIRVRLLTGGRVVTVEVDDEGPGVAPADQPHIWEPFWRAAHSAEGGSGLGLAIVKDLVRRHGGDASVSRGDRGGAKFVVTFDAPEAA